MMIHSLKLSRGFADQNEPAYTAKVTIRVGYDTPDVSLSPEAAADIARLAAADIAQQIIDAANNAQPWPPTVGVAAE